ncbi:MAG: hypothetical protein HDR88_07145 [Bacteroides sp.]|nr:hypothetical protein [Bacteroides sp.]
MKISLIKYIIILPLLFAACNDDIFVKRQNPEQPPIEEPSIDSEPKPEVTDSLILTSFVYDKESLTIVDDAEVILDAKTTFVNHTSSKGVWILYDNYNHSIVQIHNNTYYVTPWAKSDMPYVEVPGIDSDGNPGFYGTEIQFAFGTTIIPRQYMAGYKEYFDLPPHSQVSATIYTTYHSVVANADIKYYSSSYPTLIEDGWVTVKVTVPVDIHVEWSEITPAE